jgi:CRISPR system Cascade subunit CasE
MYLSRLQLNPAHPQARRDLASAYELHRSLTRAFAPNAATPPPRFLWRREADRSGLPGTTVLVQAAQAAAWHALQDADEIGSGYFVALQGNKRVSLQELVQEGRRYRFRLCANPTVTRDGKRFGLHDDEARHGWLLRQGQRHGFEVVAAERGASGRLRVAQGRRERSITMDVVLFDGVLQAADANALCKALAAGIGPGKALGLGMLSLAPMRPHEVS